MVEFFNTSILFILGVSVFTGIMVGLLIYWAYTNVYGSVRNSFDKQMLELMREEIGDPLPKSSNSIWGKWCTYWYKLYSGAGVSRYYDNKKKAGIETLLVLVVFFVVLFLVSWNIYISVLFVPLPLMVLGLVLKKKHDIAVRNLNDQLPGFLFALKANIQASKTPEQALISITDSMPEPLHSEIVEVKANLLSGQSFEQALQGLAKKTKIRELEDLARYMVISNNAGTSLIQSIDTIQEILVKKREISEEKSRAISATRPDLWASLLTIPTIFLFMWWKDPTGRDFWFVNPLSIPIIIAIFSLYALGVYYARKAVRVLEDKQR